MAGSVDSQDDKVYTAEVFSDRGRIWDRKPEVQAATGLSTVIKNLKNDKFQFQAAAFNHRGDTAGSVDQRGTVYLFRFSQNRYATGKSCARHSSS